MKLWMIAAALVLAAYGIAAAPAPLPRSTVIVDTPRGPVKLAVEVAADDTSRLRGLMYRKSLDANSGMLFDFYDNQFRDFWMKNTYLPLDMIFIRGDGTVSSVAPNATPLSERIISSQEPVRAVLELNAGRAAALDIRPGERVHNAVFANALAGQ
jgi:uncharacterized membrane protein (UPF0127 family)